MVPCLWINNRLRNIMDASKVTRFQPSDFRDNIIEFLWEQYSKDSFGDIPINDLARLRESFISGFLAARGLFCNLIPNFNDEDATMFLTRMNGEANHLITEIKQMRKNRKGLA